MSDLYREVVKKAIRAEDTSLDSKINEIHKALKTLQTEWSDRIDDLYLTDAQVDGLAPIIEQLILSERSEADRLGENFIVHTKNNRVQKLDNSHISITNSGISFGKTKPPYTRAVIEYNRQNNCIRFHEPSNDEYGISYKIGINPRSGVYYFRCRPFNGILPHGYYKKISDHTYQLHEFTENNIAAITQQSNGGK